VTCDSGGSGFGFFNVTNLTIESVQFSGCGWWVIPEVVTKYINESNQFFYYSKLKNDFRTALLFSHCYNLTLYNALPLYYYDNDIPFLVIGVNLHGWSNITLMNPGSEVWSTMLIYYTDSSIMPANSECNLHIETHLSGLWHGNIAEDLTKSTERMPISPIRDFALYITQQDFKVDVGITVHSIDDYTMFGLAAVIMFVNSVTDSHVTFQGHSYQVCSEPSSLQLDVVFYESPSFNSSVVKNRITPVLIKNTSFALLYEKDSFLNDGFLRVLQFTRDLSYQVAIEQVAWCNNSIFNPFGFNSAGSEWVKLLHAQSYSQDASHPQVLHLKLTNVFAQYNGQSYRNPLLESLVQLVNVVCTISGNSYFRKNF
jgi:hypothetical protein